MSYNRLTYKEPDDNYGGPKTPPLHEEHSECGGKDWRYYSPQDSYFKLGGSAILS